MKASELREKSIEDLSRMEVECQEELFKLRMQHGMRKLTKTDQLTNVRRDIARIKTIMTEKKGAEK